MQTSPLLYGLIGFFMGGLLVSVAATTFDKPTTPAHQQSLSSLEDKTGDDFDRAFIEQMIVHHEGAIDMARLADTNAQHQEVKDLSGEIITAQQKEIDQLEQWQSDWGYQEKAKADAEHSDGSH